MTEHIDLDRKFLPVEADEEDDPESIQTMYTFGLGQQPGMDQQLSWDNLLENDRAVIIAEPGTGKTEEFKAVTKRLRILGKFAFFFRIELLQSHGLAVRQCLDIGTSEEFDEWLAGKKEAYFFLDSIDEARLASHTSFEIALRRFANTIDGNLNRAKVFISCRVRHWRATADLSLFSELLPKPNNRIVLDSVGDSTEEPIEVNRRAASSVRAVDSEEKEDHIVFQLIPLNDRQIQHFAAEKGVDDTKEFIEAIERADANIFAERPQDLLDLIEYWRSNSRLGTHTEMMDFNIQKKLEEHNPDRDDLRPLSADDAVLGAERMATAMTKRSRVSMEPVLPFLRIYASPGSTLMDPLAGCGRTPGGRRKLGFREDSPRG